MKKLWHCKDWVTAYDSHGLEPKKDLDSEIPYIRIIAVEYCCKGRSCGEKGVFHYRWYGIQEDGTESDLTKIHQDDWKLTWLPRIEKTKAVEQENKGHADKFKMIVCEWSSRVKKPADIALIYLKRTRAISCVGFLVLASFATHSLDVTTPGIQEGLDKVNYANCQMEFGEFLQQSIDFSQLSDAARMDMAIILHRHCLKGVK